MKIQEQLERAQKSYMDASEQADAAIELLAELCEFWENNTAVNPGSLLANRAIRFVRDNSISDR